MCLYEMWVECEGYCKVQTHKVLFLLFLFLKRRRGHG